MNYKDGSWAGDKRKARHKKYREENKEQIAAKRKVWREKNKSILRKPKL